MKDKEVSDLTRKFLNREFGEPKEEYNTWDKAYNKIKKLKEQIGGMSG